MGKYNNGILGPFSGKIGAVVGSSYRGVPLMRSRPRTTKRPPTENQKLQRQKFAVVVKFLTPLKPITSRYFGTEAGTSSRTSRAISYHLKEALFQDGTTTTLLFDKVQLSSGSLPSVLGLTVQPEAGRTLRFSWQDNSGQATARPTDRLVVAVHDAVNERSQVFLEAGTRQQGEAVVVLSEEFTDSRVHCWIAFASAGDKVCSTGVYLGEVATG